MDVAKRFVQWTEQPPEQWLKAANRYIRPVVMALLVVAIAYQLAELTRALLPGEPLDAPEPAAPATVVQGQVSSAPDVSHLAEAHLFGEPPKEAPVAVVQTVVDAPDTTLSLRLTGVQAYPESSVGQAIIADARNQERAYRIGDTVEGANGAELHAVYSDRVILNRGGRLETLRLPEEPSSRGATAAAARPVMPRPAAAPGGSLREVISENASRITDVVRVAPHVEGGEMVGFRVNPGREREQFMALGLEPGDVITDINGTLLNDPARGLEVFEALGEATQANVTVLRDGVPQVLVIDTTQLQSLAAGRQ